MESYGWWDGGWWVESNYLDVCLLCYVFKIEQKPKPRAEKATLKVPIFLVADHRSVLEVETTNRKGEVNGMWYSVLQSATLIACSR